MIGRKRQSDFGNDTATWKRQRHSSRTVAELPPPAAVAKCNRGFFRSPAVWSSPQLPVLLLLLILIVFLLPPFSPRRDQ